MIPRIRSPPGLWDNPRYSKVSSHCLKRQPLCCPEVYPESAPWNQLSREVRWPKFPPKGRRFQRLGRDPYPQINHRNVKNHGGRIHPLGEDLKGCRQSKEQNFKLIEALWGDEPQKGPAIRMDQDLKVRLLQVQRHHPDNLSDRRQDWMNRFHPDLVPITHLLRRDKSMMGSQIPDVFITTH